MLSVALSLNGARVQTARSASDAMEAVQTFRPDVLLSDVGLPGESGISLIRRVRELPPERGGRTPAIALTAFGPSALEQDARSAGFDLLLHKPADLGRLVADLAKLARQPRIV